MNPLPALPLPARRLLLLGAAVLALVLALALLSSGRSARADVPPLDLETLTGAEAEEMMEAGELTSVGLVKAYLARIEALNKSGPGLNAVTQINPDVMAEAEEADRLRSEGTSLGPAMGLPILLKDIIDAKGMYTSAGDYALRSSYPERDSGVAKELRAHGVVILGKTGLSEWANSFGSQPSGFSNLTGQVLNANDTAQGPSGSSSGSGAAGASALASLTIGTETSGSIISPSREQSLVGLRPTVGLVPGYGIAPILASQDTAGPMERTVADAAITLQSIAEVPGTDPEADAEYEPMMGPEFHANGVIPLAPFTELPDYTSALSLSFVNGKRIGYNGTCPAPCSSGPTANQAAVEKAVEVLEDAGAIMVPDEPTTVGTLEPLPANYEAHATIDGYYAHLGAGRPVPNLAGEVAIDSANPQEGAKDGNSKHADESRVDITPGGANQLQYETNLQQRKTAYHKAINDMLETPSGGGGPVIAVIGSVPSGPQAGYPQVTVPMGYTATQRRAVAVSVNGGAYDERDLIGVSYVIEQETKLRKPPAEVNPAAYRCSRTTVPAPFAARGHCNPDYTTVMAMLGGTPKLLPFALETTSATQLEQLMAEGKLSAEELVKAELYRAALTNAQGPAIQAIRALAPDAIAQALASDQRRAEGKAGPLEGIPVLLDDSIDVAGLATSGGSIALQDNLPSADATLVGKLKAAGAIILGDTNTTELGGEMEGSNMPQGYSSLGGQVLLPADTNKSIGGSSAGSAAAVSVGLSPLAIGLETSTEAAQMVLPSGNAGLVGLKPTVGLVSRSGVIPVARSQDSPGPIGQTVADVASALDVLAGPDAGDPATAGQPSPLPDYTAGLSPSALTGKKVATVAMAETEATFPTYARAVAELEDLEARVTTVTPGAAPAAASVIPYEFHRDLDSFLAGTPGGGAESLQQVIEYDTANPIEGLKFGQARLTAAQAIDPEEPTAKATYEANLATGRGEAQAVIDKILTNNTPEGGDDYTALMVPQGSSLVGIADRAGYPVLTVPAGFAKQNSNAGGDPLGVVFIGAEYSEAELLADGYAFEQKRQARQSGPGYMRAAAEHAPNLSGAPSQTNQSMFRCVPGSAFYKPYDCNPGEIPAPPSVVSGGGEPAGGDVAATPPPPIPTPLPAKLKLAKLKRLTGRGTALIEVHVSGPGSVVLTGRGVVRAKAKVTEAGDVWLAVKPRGRTAKILNGFGQAKVKVKIVFTSSDGTKDTELRTVVLKKR